MTAHPVKSSAVSLHCVLVSAVSIFVFVALAVSMPLAQPAIAAGPWYVAPSGSDSNACDSPAAPCATINAALGKPACVAGDTIRVAIGEYRGTGEQIVLLNKSVTLAGGWDAGFATQAGTSTIDGQPRAGASPWEPA